MTGAALRGAARDHPSAAALMDATDRLLDEVGYAGISIRRITEEAGLAHGSIRYHFGSLHALLVATLGRDNEPAFERQRALYESGRPTAQIWRTASREFMEADLESGWGRRLVEALIIGIRDPEAGRALSQVLEPWRELVRAGTHAAVQEYGLDVPNRLVDGITTLIMTSQLGMMIERLSGTDRNHEEALDAVDALLQSLERRTTDG